MNKVEMLIEAEKMFGEKVEAAYKAQLEKAKAVIQKHVEASGVQLAAGVSIKIRDVDTGIKRDENGEYVKDDKGNFVYNVVPEIKKVEKVTAKMVYWAEWKGQDKKYDVISKLATGKWTIVG